MSNTSPENLHALLSLVSVAHQPALQRAIDFMQNPTQQTAEAVAPVMNDLFEIKQNMRNRDKKIKQLDDIIKFAVRATESFPTTQHFFEVKPARQVGKIEDSAEMLHRLLKIFENPLDFSSCVEFNFNELQDLMGDKFIKENADIISVKDYDSAVYLRKEAGL